MSRRKKKNKKVHSGKKTENRDIWEDDDWLSGTYSIMATNYDDEFADIFDDDDDDDEPTGEWDADDYILMADDDEDEDDY